MKNTSKYLNFDRRFTILFIAIVLSSLMGGAHGARLGTILYDMRMERMLLSPVHSDGYNGFSEDCVAKCTDFTKLLLTVTHNQLPYFLQCAPGRKISIVKFTLPYDRDLLLEIYTHLENLMDRAAQRAASRCSQSNDFDFRFRRDYIKDRIEFDEPGGGFLVLEHTRFATFPTGLLMYNEFATWAQGFEFVAQKGDDFRLTDRLAGLNRKKLNNHIAFPQLCELSILLGMGTGRGLMKLFVEQLADERKYPFVITETLASSRSFYEQHGFKKIGARAEFIMGKRNKLHTTRSYYHYRSRDEVIHWHENPSLMLVKVLEPDSGMECDSYGCEMDTDTP